MDALNVARGVAAPPGELAPVRFVVTGCLPIFCKDEAEDMRVASARCCGARLERWFGTFRTSLRSRSAPYVEPVAPWTGGGWRRGRTGGGGRGSFGAGGLRGRVR